MKVKKYYIYLLLPLLLLSCKDDLESVAVSEGEIELTQIDAIIATASGNGMTRAEGDPDPVPVVYLEDHISRFRFVDADRMTFTTVKRTENALLRFTYKDITFLNNSSGAWDRDKNTGSDGLNGSNSHPERIYWSDATSRHTFIGYSLPNVSGFDWELKGTTYYGSIGNPTEKTQINYNPSPSETDEITVIEDKVEKPKTIPMSSLMRAEDLLLTYDTEVVADASVAHIKFYHGLSSIKVKVMLSDFYGSELDGYTIVDNMILKNQPTLYKWEQTSYKTSANSNTHSENNPRDMFLWDYVPAGVGENAGKSFTFYGITVPQESGYDMQDLVLTFRVKYPDPMKTDLALLKTNGTQPEHWLEKEYTATIYKNQSPGPVYFHPNQCTIINIRLNHKDETMTIGAQYTDWEFVPTPDEGSLKKNSTYLQSAPTFANRPSVKKVTVATDPEATEDDATWLYYQKNQDGTFVAGNDEDKVLLDIYGNTGTKEKPYTISTADQLLSLAYEVSNGGHSFDGKYIKLDAGIILQKDNDLETLSWLGIGDGSHPFQGTFLGGGRKISRLKGAPLFNNVGDKALIDNVVIENPLSLTGNAALAQTNAGVICACRVNGDVGCAGSGAVASLVGTNSGTIFACHHNGAVIGSGTVAGLVGTNTGAIRFSYHAGELTGTTKYGIAPDDGTITDCYYDNKLTTDATGVSGVTGISTGDMQKESFVNNVLYTAEEAEAENASHLTTDESGKNPEDAGYTPTYETGYTPIEAGAVKQASLNGKMQTWVNALPNDNPMKTHYATHEYIYQPAAYPKINDD